MAHGTRGRWLRVAATGFGVMLCTGLVGCLNNDKPKDTKIGANKPLPGTARLDANGNPVGLKTGQPTNPYGNPYAGSNVQPAGNTQLTPAGAGIGSGMPPGGQYQRYPTNGLNTNTGSVPPQNYGGPAGTPGGGATMGTPAMPGYGPPAGGSVTPSGYLNGGGSMVTPAGGASSPQPVSLVDMQLPAPPAPPAGHGSEFGSSAGAGAPITPPTGLGPVGPGPLPPSGPPTKSYPSLDQNK